MCVCMGHISCLHSTEFFLSQSTLGIFFTYPPESHISIYLGCYILRIQRTILFVQILAKTTPKPEMWALICT